MVLIIRIMIMGMILYLGMICIKDPIKIAKMITVVTKPMYKLMIGQRSESKVELAFHLIENDIKEYASTFHFQISIIRLTGYVALAISVVGMCLFIVGE